MLSVNETIVSLRQLVPSSLPVAGGHRRGPARRRRLAAGCQGRLGVTAEMPDRRGRAPMQVQLVPTCLSASASPPCYSPCRPGSFSFDEGFLPFAQARAR
eukprot:746615-Hanusia_phi.AAC.2